MIRNNKGFTLIEMIATITIMLVIVSIAIPSAIHFIDRGQEQEYKLIKDKIEVAAQEYYKYNDVTVNSIPLSTIIDYIDLDEKYFVEGKIKDPRDDSKCLNGSVSISLDTTISSKDKYKFVYDGSVINCP